MQTEFEQNNETKRMVQDAVQSSKSLKSKRVVDVAFKNISYNVYGLNNTKREILKNINGICPGGEVTAIMGSSGAGKTSLLNILAARVRSTGKVELKGQILANNAPYDADRFSNFASYVMQNDVLFETLTPKEAFEFVANLKYVDSELKRKRVEETIKVMKLDRCKNALIGGESFKGISGGERKRTSIGFELVTNPSCILLDEPTSGLDSFTAFQIIFELAQLAHDQDRTIIFTIHQPSSDIFLLFDRIMLLVQGQLIYQGPRSNIISHFREFGFPCPDHSNPMDYLISITHGDNQKNKENYPIFFEQYQKKLSPIVDEEIIKSAQTEIVMKRVETSALYQVSRITDRAIKSFLRNRMAIRQRFGMALFMGFVVGGAFWGVGQNDGSYAALSGVSGVLFLLMLNLSIGSITPVILQFSVERDVFLREENSKLYTTLSYFIGKSMVEIPFCVITPIIQELILYWMVDLNYMKAETVVIHILVCILACLNGNSIGLMAGCAFNDIKTATSIVPLLIMPLVLFSGFFANSKTFFSWIGWIQYISPVKYGFEALAVNEFNDRVYEVDPIAMYDFQIGIWGSVVILIGYMILYRIGAFLFLYALRSKQQ